MSKCEKILITGLPGCGKTTAIRRIAANFRRKKIAGFFTEEIRQNNIRKGFLWNLLDGSSGILAHVDIKSNAKVGKYGVDISGFEKAVIPVLNAQTIGIDLFVIDEIGKMECLSDKFVAAMQELLASDKSILATIAQKGSGFISEAKKLPGIQIFNITTGNRDKIIIEIFRLLST